MSALKTKVYKPAEKYGRFCAGGRHGKDIKFTFGDREKQLMEYLEAHQQITVTQFAQLVGLSRYHASRTLILLVLGSVLRVIPQEKEDVFVLR